MRAQESKVCPAPSLPPPLPTRRLLLTIHARSITLTIYVIYAVLASLATFAVAQQTSFEPATGVRSLWVRKQLKNPPVTWRAKGGAASHC